jgi:hypothetical protein
MKRLLLGLMAIAAFFLPLSQNVQAHWVVYRHIYVYHHVYWHHRSWQHGHWYAGPWHSGY